MGKPPGQSEFDYVSPELDHDEDMARHGSHPLIAKLTYAAIVIALVALFVLVAVELHVPRGE